jgi:capsular polysaccharide biosynthesis protein/Mrp family chromosome partitioning ATPase
VPTYDNATRPRLLADAFRRRWLVVAVAAFIGLLAGAGFKLLKTTTYDGQTSVLIHPIPGNPFHLQSQNNLLIDMSTEAQVVRSDAVARLVVPILTAKGYTNVTVSGLLGRVRATLETNTQVLRITSSARSATRARDGADAFAQAFLAYRGAQAKGDNQTVLKEIADERKRDETFRSGFKSSLAQTDPTSATAARLQAQIKTVDQKLNDLSVREADILKRKTVPGVVLSPAALPQAPHGTSRTLLAAGGLLLGLIAGLVVAIGLERASGRIRRPDAIPSDLDVLAVVHPSGVAQPVLLTHPDHMTAEPYRLLHLGVEAALRPESSRISDEDPMVRAPARVIVVASLSDPAPPVGINYALAAAEAGRSTTYVDALPANVAPSLPGLTVPQDATGLSEVVLEGRDPLSARLHMAPRLTYVPAGRSVQRAAEAYAGPRMRGIVDVLRRGCDLLVIAVPSLTNPDGQALASLADGVLLVVPMGSARVAQLDEAAAEARRVHATLIGVVAAYPGRSRRAVPAPPTTATNNVVVRDERPPAPATRITS